MNLSDHQAIFVVRKRINFKDAKINFTGISYKNYNKEDFQDNLRALHWNDFFGIENPNECWDIFYNRIISTLEDMCPEKNI